MEQDKDKKPQEQSQQHDKAQQENKAADKAGIGQTDEEKGILPKELRDEKKKQLEDEGKAIKRPTFHRDDDELPVQLKNDDK